MNPADIHGELEMLLGWPWSRDHISRENGARVVEKWDGKGELQIAIIEPAGIKFARIKVAVGG